MNSASLILQLDRFGKTLPSLVHDIPIADARWKPPDNAWSILEVVRHLLDEELEDFRVRLRLTLESPESEWPKIDPQGWATKRKYNQADLQDSAQRFGAERAANVKWLRSLSPETEWSTARPHPKFGPIHAGDLLAAWAAHDALHLRQISKRLFQLAQRDAGKYSVRYAGEWTA
ncbi:MAG: DinB family protein [Phycisphaerales bacterium]|nr:DinB family protein [Phycisphaerales bacterium]MCI0676683.1 DinB family protein [Phycisphaerales bacterium]